LPVNSVANDVFDQIQHDDDDDDDDDDDGRALLIEKKAGDPSTPGFLATDIIRRGSNLRTQKARVAAYRMRTR